MYAKVENNAVVKYPYGIRNLQLDNPNTSFTASALSNPDVRNDYGVVEVTSVNKPSSESVGKVYSEGTPVLDGNVWKQSWDETSLSAAEISAINEKKVIDARMEEYGSVAEQIEFITENGLTPWQTKVAEIKARHPKG